MLSNILELIQRIFNIFIWWTVIQPWEQGLLVRLGRNPKLLPPGFHFKIPYADAIYRQTVRRRYSNFGPQTITTLDGASLTLSGTIGYSIRDLLELYDRLAHAEDAIQSMAMGSIAEYCASRPLSDCAPASIEAFCRTELGLRKFGILVHQFTLTTYARVRAYRLIGDGRDTMWGDALNTDKKEA